LNDGGSVTISSAVGGASENVEIKSPPLSGRIEDDHYVGITTKGATLADRLVISSSASDPLHKLVADAEVDVPNDSLVIHIPTNTSGISVTTTLTVRGASSASLESLASAEIDVGSAAGTATKLQGASTVGQNFVWNDSSGNQYTFIPDDKKNPTRSGTLIVSGTLLGNPTNIAGAGNQLEIKNFDLAKAKTSFGYLGIHLALSDAVAARLIGSMPSNPFDDPAFDANTAPTPTAEVKDGGTATYALYLPYPADTDGQKVRIQLSGDSANGLRVRMGNQIITPDNGGFDLTVKQGSR
jgi:hypothetical protein